MNVNLPLNIERGRPQKIMNKINWKYETRKITDLIPAEYNPRQANEKEIHDLNASIDQFNLADPIIINKNNRVIGGHFRLRVLQSKGVTEVDVRVPDRELVIDEERKLNLRLNKNSGSWDFDALANFDEDMLKEIGFDASELDRIFELDDHDKDKADDVGPVPDATDIKRGDMFQLGKHRLMCGDATNPGDLVVLMEGKKAAMIFTDPPYNVNYTGGTGDHDKNSREGILNDKMERPEFRDFLLAASRNIIEHCLGGIYICMSSRELDTLKGAFEEAGGHYQSTVIWVRNNFTLSRSDYQHLYEPMLYGWPGTIKNHYFIDRRDLAQ